MKIAIIGATGGTGRHFLQLASERGHDVTALARTPSKLDAGPPSVKVRRADARDATSLADALDADLDAVVSIVGASGLLEARKVTDLYSVSASNLIEALSRKRLKRLVVVSSAGVESQPNDGWFYNNILKRFFLGPMYADMVRMEALVRASNHDWTVVRPPYLTSGEPTGRYRVSKDANFVDDRSLRRGDLADFLVRTVEEPDAWVRSVVRLSE